jgi:hypothetical protein
MAKQKTRRVELTSREVGYLSSIVEARSARMFMLGKKQQERPPVKAEQRLIATLSRKLTP